MPDKLRKALKIIKEDFKIMLPLFLLSLGLIFISVFVLKIYFSYILCHGVCDPFDSVIVTYVSGVLGIFIGGLIFVYIVSIIERVEKR